MTAKLPCPAASDLEHLLLGHMPEIEMTLLEQHVLGCPNCLEAIRAVKTEDTLVSAVRAGGKIGSIPAEQIDEPLMARLCLLRQGASTGPSWAEATPGGPAVPGTEKVEEFSNLLAPPQALDELGRIGGYGILRVLGSGGMGIVLAARQHRPRRLVAMKMILAGVHPGRQPLQRFRSESDILARLRHPHIVQVHEVGEQAGRPYFTMDYAEGGSLAQKLAAATLPARAAAELIEIVARAVHAAHQQHIVHRDLKPSNILLSADDAPLIGDFGLAKELSAELDQAAAGRTETGAILGTPGYMAPEQIAGVKQLGPAVDIYALGAILYECLTGRPPFKAATVLQTLEQARSEEPVPPRRLQAGLPRDLETICLHCLEKEPRRRYATAQQLADDLGRFLRGEAIQARAVTPWERAWKWARRQPTAAALIAVSALSLVMLVTGVLVYNARLLATLERAETGEAKAKEQQLRADANYRTARDAVQRMLTRLEHHGLADVPRLTELQQQQLEDALEFYEKILVGLDSPDPEVRLDVARACRQTGAIQSKLGRNEPAEKNLRQAVHLVEGLEAEAPDHLEFRGELAADCTVLGEVLRANEARRGEAERWLKRALDLRRQVIEAEPTAAQRHELAETLLTHALLYLSMGQHWDHAKAHLDEAAAIWEQLVSADIQTDVYRVNLANTYSNLGHYYEWIASAQPDEAEAVYRKAEPLLESLVAKSPGEIEWAASLAKLYARQGNILLHHHRKPEEALARFTSALDTLQALLKQEPRYAPAQHMLVHAHGGRAYAFEWLHRFQEAVPEWDRVVELQGGPMKEFRRSERACTLARAGDHVRAAAEAAALCAAESVQDAVLYNSACAYSIAVGAALEDQQLSQELREVLAEQYGAAGVALLERLRQSGFFRDPQWIRQLKEDSEFAPLRKRPECEKLLREWQASELSGR